MDSDSSSTESNSSSCDEQDPISTRLDELWSLVNGENSSYEKLDELMESLASTLVRHREKWRQPSWSIQSAEVEKLVEAIVKLIGASDNSGATCKHQISAVHLLAATLAEQLLDCDQTKQVYKVLMETLQTAIAKEQYSTLLIGSLSQCLSQLNYKHVITKEEAADLMKQLIPVAGIAFIKETLNLSHEERYDLIQKMCFHEFYPHVFSYVNKNYRGLMMCLYSLARYYGLDEYYEYAKSVFQYAELKGVVNGEILVILNVLMIVNRSTCFGTFGERFLDELAQITMGLMCISTDYIWGHLVHLLLARLESIMAHYNPVDRYDMSVLLVDHLLKENDDPVADRVALRLLCQNIFMFGDISGAYEGKKRALLVKLNQVEIDEDFREEFSRHFRADDEP